MDTVKQAEKDKFWAYVTVFGTLWGGLELTLGTFLHVLHVPKTGFIMVGLSCILLIAQRRIFPARWSTLATAVVAACIKSLSPGGMIVGPIYGILTEGLMIELCVLAGSRRVASGILATTVALTWSQLQSVFKMWVYYGMDFLQSIIKVIEKFLKIEWTAAVGWGVVAILLIILVGTGCVVGVLGNRLGTRVERELQEVGGDVTMEGMDESSVDQTMDVMGKIAGKGKRGSTTSEDAVRTRVILLPVAVLTLVLQFTGDLWVPIVRPFISGLIGDELAILVAAVVAWLMCLLIGARSVLRAIWWPKFWGVTLVVSVLCGVILAWQFDKGFNWGLGVDASVRMFLRGLYVFSLVSWATRCVRTSEVLTVWEKLHLPGLGHALTRAYVLLPAWLDKMNEMVKSRPKGFRENWQYVRECSYRCIVDAARQTDWMVRQNGAGAPPGVSGDAG